MSKKLNTLSLSEARDGLAKKDFTSVEITQAFLDRIPELKELNAYVAVTGDIALAQAKASDERRATSEVLPLDGLPIAIKDLYCTKGVRTTAASKILSNFIPQYESTVTSNLWRDGAVMLAPFALVALDMFAASESLLLPLPYFIVVLFSSSFSIVASVNCSDDESF